MLRIVCIGQMCVWCPASLFLVPDMSPGPIFIKKLKLFFYLANENKGKEPIEESDTYTFDLSCFMNTAPVLKNMSFFLFSTSIQCSKT